MYVNVYVQYMCVCMCVCIASVIKVSKNSHSNIKGTEAVEVPVDGQVAMKAYGAEKEFKMMKERDKAVKDT